MADQSFIEKQSDGDGARVVGVSYKIRKIGFPVAVVLCVLLLVVCVVLAVLYSQKVTKITITSKEPDFEICNEERCFRLGMELVNNMDEKIDPCKDFYAYACQGWENKNPAKNGSIHPVSTTPSLGEDDYTTLKKALEIPMANYSQNAAVLKTLRFYNSCINTTATNAVGLQPLEDLVQEYGGWSVSSNIDPSVPLTTRMGKLLRELNVETLLHFGVEYDHLNPTKRVLELSEPNTGLNMYYYHEKNSSSILQHQAYKRLLKTVGRMFSRSNSSDDKMMAIYDFEKSIFKIFKENDETQSRKLTHFAGSKSRQRRSGDPKESHMSLLSFSNVSGMPKTLSIIFKRDFSGNEEISFNSITNTKLWRNLYILIQGTNESVVVDYMMWQVIREYLRAVPELYNLTISEFYQAANNETTVDPLRSKQCILIMSSPFDSTLGFLYLELVIKNDPKKKIEKVFENIRSSFIERLERDTWMDPRTKENAKQKALAMKGNIAYPSYIKNPSELEKRYQSLHITENFFLNYKAISQFSAVKNFNTYGTPVDTSEWTPDKIYVMNAFYIAEHNKIVVPAGIIQPPFYSPDFPMYLVYGGIGMVIGHEITHGFDGLGRKYDSDGKKEDWWSKSSSESFNQKAKCLEEQYNKFPVFGKNINGSLTLDENIADNGGIRLAYEAYQRWKKENGSEKILPGLTLSPDQLFFVGFAQLWCSSFNEASADYSTKYDPVHAFPKYRVIGPLTNFNKFSEAFNCPANSPMNPSTKCGIW